MIPSAARMSIKQAMPESLVSALGAMDGAVTAAEKALEPFLNASCMRSLVTQLQPIDNARLNTALSFVATSLIYAHLRVEGTDVATHAIKDEVDATKRLFGRVQDVEQLLTAAQPSKERGEVARRFVTAALGAESLSGQVRKRAEDAHAASARDDADALSEDGDDHDSSDGEAAKPVSKKWSSDKPAESSPRDRKGDSKRPRKSDTGSRQHKSASHAANKATPKKAGGLDDKKRSTPQPNMSHLKWKEEMDKKFGSR